MAIATCRRPHGNDAQAFCSLVGACSCSSLNKGAPRWETPVSTSPGLQSLVDRMMEVRCAAVDMGCVSISVCRACSLEIVGRRSTYQVILDRPPTSAAFLAVFLLSERLAIIRWCRQELDTRPSDKACCPYFGPRQGQTLFLQMCARMYWRDPLTSSPNRQLLQLVATSPIIHGGNNLP